MASREGDIRDGLGQGRLYGVSVEDESGISRMFKAFWRVQDSMFYLHDRTWESTGTMEFRLTTEAGVILAAMREIAPSKKWKEGGDRTTS